MANIIIVQNIKIMRIFFSGHNIFRDYDHVSLVLKLSLQSPSPIIKRPKIKNTWKRPATGLAIFRQHTNSLNLKINFFEIIFLICEYNVYSMW